MSFEIVTDSSANLLRSQIDQIGAHILPLVFFVDGEERRSYYKDSDTDLKVFYDIMRDGKLITTSLPHLDEIEKTLRGILEEGKDLLYIGFSSGLSGTFDAVRGIIEELRTEFPQQKALCVDTLGASLGQGLLVHYAAKKRDEGVSIEDVQAWVEENKLHLAHWFTVDDLMYLFRGGRVTKSTAWAANLLNIKPVLNMDDEGHLVPKEKVRGRKKSIQALVSHMRESAIAPVEDQTVFISHGDCLEDAQLLERLVRSEFGVKDVVINYVDPVIGAHSGPGTLALFFLATERG